MGVNYVITGILAGMVLRQALVEGAEGVSLIKSVGLYAGFLADIIGGGPFSRTIKSFKRR